jgi:hypothetical protein
VANLTHSASVHSRFPGPARVASQACEAATLCNFNQVARSVERRKRGTAFFSMLDFLNFFWSVGFSSSNASPTMSVNLSSDCFESGPPLFSDSLTDLNSQNCVQER